MEFRKPGGADLPVLSFGPAIFGDAPGGQAPRDYFFERWSVIAA